MFPQSIYFMKYLKLLTIEMHNRKDGFAPIDANYFPNLENIRYEYYEGKDVPKENKIEYYKVHFVQFYIKTFDFIKNPPLNFKTMTFVCAGRPGCKTFYLNDETFYKNETLCETITHV